jgi:ABC-type multidrug transport system fused ATPase/permease subunit
LFSCLYELATDLDRDRCHADSGLLPEYFSKMQVAFEDVRNQISNMNSFVQERVTGMKIVQLFHREDIEAEKFKNINDKHKKSLIKRFYTTRFSFPLPI